MDNYIHTKTNAHTTPYHIYINNESFIYIYICLYTIYFSHNHITEIQMKKFPFSYSNTHNHFPSSYIVSYVSIYSIC